MEIRDFVDYREGPFSPVINEVETDNLEAIGEIPKDLKGMFVRNGPNNQYPPSGRYHWFDGDGMLHGVQFNDGKASYCNSYIQTRGFQEERKEGKTLWGGIMDPIPQIKLPGGPLKNTSNTDLVFHHGKLLSLWWLGREPYEISVPSLKTVGPYNFNGDLPSGIGMSAHPKVDQSTGEMMFMDFSFFKAPFLHYGVVSKEGKLVRMVPIEIPGPRILHDLAITENYTILLDLPLLWDPKLLLEGKRKIIFDKEAPARFGVLPRHGDNSSIRWFEGPACYIYHAINAYEEGDEIVMVACRVENPMPRKDCPPHVPRLDYIQLEPYLHRWRFHLKTGKVREEVLDDISTEFPRMNNAYLGRKARYTYNPRIAPSSRLLFDGLIKYDLEKNDRQILSFGTNCFGGEAVFVPRPQSTTEDDGWVMTFLYYAGEERSEFVIIDAKNFEAGPVCRIKLPQRVPIGFHAYWVDHE